MRVTLDKPLAADTPAISVVMMDPDVVGWLGNFPDPRVDYDRTQGPAPSSDYIIRVDDRFAGIVIASPELGCWIDPRYKGTGIATRASTLALSRYYAGGALLAYARPAGAKGRARHMLDRLGFTDATATNVDSPLLSLSRQAFARAQPFQVLTRRTLIQGIRPADLEPLYDIASLRAVSNQLGFFRPGMTLNEFGEILRPFSATPDFWATIRSEERVIGAIGLGPSTTGGRSLNIFLSPLVSGLEFASEVLPAYLEEMQDRFAMTEIEAELFSDDAAAARVLEKAGFRLQEEFVMISPIRSDRAQRYRLVF